MTIYATPYDPTTQQATGESTDSGFVTLEQAELALGPPTVRYAAMLIYKYGPINVAYTRLPFHIDQSGNSR